MSRLVDELKDHNGAGSFWQPLTQKRAKTPQAPGSPASPQKASTAAKAISKAVTKKVKAASKQRAA